MIFLALVVGHCICEGENEAEYADIHPEELEPKQIHECEETPDSWCQVEACPKDKGVSCPYLLFTYWIIIAFKDPLLLANLIYLRPPPQFD